jgi:hypothetical protein
LLVWNAGLWLARNLGLLLGRNIRLLLGLRVRLLLWLSIGLLLWLSIGHGRGKEHEQAGEHDGEAIIELAHGPSILTSRSENRKSMHPIALLVMLASVIKTGRSSTSSKEQHRA